MKLATTHCYDIYVLTQVFDEVKQMSEDDAKKLGIIIIEPSLSQLIEAVEDSSALSDEACLCLIIARDNAWTCATNDKRLYSECRRESVAVIRGLKIMLELNARQKLTTKNATAIARKIQTSNPRLTEKVIQEVTPHQSDKADQKDKI